MMDKPIVIVGASTNARLAHFYFRKERREVLGFAIHSKFIKAPTFCDLPIWPLEELERLHSTSTIDLFVAIGYSNINSIRQQVYLEMKKRGYHFASYISPKCNYLSQFSPGENAFILEDNTIQPYVKIGCNVVLWSGNHIGHDTIIEDHVFVSSQVVISGEVHIRENSFLGVNSTVANTVELGHHSLIGAGATVTGNTEPYSVIVPARSALLEKKSTEIKI